MKRLISLAWLAAMGALPFSQAAYAQHADYDALVASHASANGVPEALVHRVIVRESRYQPKLVGRGGTIGLMQIKLATARALGYTGDAAGLHDPNTNLAYGTKYLAGAYRAANGDHARAMHYYASGYYEAAKRQRLAGGQRLERSAAQQLEHAGNPQPALVGPPENLADARAQQVSAAPHPRIRCSSGSGALTLPAIGLH